MDSIEAVKDTQHEVTKATDSQPENPFDLHHSQPPSATQHHGTPPAFTPPSSPQPTPDPIVPDAGVATGSSGSSTAADEPEPWTPVDEKSRPSTPAKKVQLDLPQVPPYPQLNNNPPASPGSTRLFPSLEDKDEEPSVPISFDRSSTSKPDPKGQEEEEDLLRRMHRFTLYETHARYYIVGSDILDSQFRIMKIDRTADEGDLSITEDEVVYTRGEMMRLLATIEDGNVASGGLKQKQPFWGLLGFIRFTGVYYMLLITKRSVVAMIGGHYIYQIDKTELVPLTTDNLARKPDRNSQEARFVSILGNLDLTRSFYFSYSYDITRTLQHNIICQREALAKGLPQSGNHDYNDMFAWNHYLLEPAKLCIKNTYDWCMPIVHGYVDQSNISVYGRSIYITIIARRSRYFAGARFLKRGANDLGYVANDVETEQIVSEMLTTSFHAPGKKLYANPNYTSYVQHRGSIPLFWTQKNDAATPKPPIDMNLVDPFYSAAALHFDDLFARYGTPIIVLNLVKSRERTPRESLLLDEFTQAIKYLNQFLPKDQNIHYIPWDMSRAAKSRDQNVIETLEIIAENVVNTTGFFHNGSIDDINPPKLQNGVCRTNCIDCLDRTNAAQFVIGKRALGHQLHALGVISGKNVGYDTDAVDLFTHMYHDHGDTIAVQYAGSHLVNTMETYRKINQWKSHPRDMLESFKRYYNNSFLDAQRQEAYNLFLGNYIFSQGQPMLWDLSTDYYLHHADPRLDRKRRSYTKWWTPVNLHPRMLPPVPELPAEKPYSYFDDYWLEYYRPKAVSSFHKVFTYNLNNTLAYVPVKWSRNGEYDLSPFVVRGTVVDPAAAAKAPGSKKKKRKPLISFHGFATTTTTAAVTANIDPPPPTPSHQTSNTSNTSGVSAVTETQEARNMAMAVEQSLNPTIEAKERNEYERYVKHHLNLAVVPPSMEKQTEYREKKISDEDLDLYKATITVPENPLAVEPEDKTKKRYMAYEKWVVTGRLKRLGGVRVEGSVGNGIAVGLGIAV